MAWNATVYIGECRPWPDGVDVTRTKGETLRYVPERTCRNVHEPPKNTTFWPSPHFKCSECGAVHVSMDYVFYCPNCGRKVE